VSTWTSECRLKHPGGDTEVFGHVPLLTIRSGPPFPAGPIYLKYGEHRGEHRGFGFQHIWKEHCRHIGDHDVAVDHVRRLVADALQPNTPIHYEYGERLEVFRLRTGSVILLLARSLEVPEYSVVTAGYFPKNAKGSRVGALAHVGP